MTSNAAEGFPHYKSPASIRNESFGRRMRGLDEEQVYQFLDGLADQVQVVDDERRAMRADNERLQAENQRLQADLQRVRTELSEFSEAGDRVNDQVVELFSQAQLVAEEMVEDVSRDARQRLGQARTQERQILEEAMQSAERTRRDAEALIRWTVPGAFDNGSADAPAERELGYSGAGNAPAADELERIRSFAQAAQTQMQTIMESFATEVGRLDAPAGSGSGMTGRHSNGSSSQDSRGRPIESSHGSSQDSGSWD